MLYLTIFLLKLIENAINTLKLIVVSNGKKGLGAILNFVSSIIWILSTIIVIKDVDKDLFKIIAFSLGCLVGSFLGSKMEEKMALGNKVILCITSKNIMNMVRNNGYKLTSTKGSGLKSTKNILFILSPRKNINSLNKLLKDLDNNCFIVIINTN